MKKVFALFAVCLVFMTFVTGCSSKRDYTNDELIRIINENGGEGAEYNPARAFDSEEGVRPMFYESYEIDKENIQAGAQSVSLINVKAYGILLIQPKEDKSEKVMEDLNGYVEKMKKSFENYLRDQYEVAISTILKQQDDGLIILVMAEDAQTIYDNIVKRLG